MNRPGADQAAQYNSISLGTQLTPDQELVGRMASELARLNAEVARLSEENARLKQQMTRCAVDIHDTADRSEREELRRKNHALRQELQRERNSRDSHADDLAVENMWLAEQLYDEQQRSATLDRIAGLRGAR